MEQKDVQCKDCSRTETVNEDMNEPWICEDCMEQHKENEARDHELEFELNQEEARQEAEDEGREIEAWQEREAEQNGY